MDEARLIDKLRKIEALFAGATTTGERVAADRARQSILERLQTLVEQDPPVEYRFSMPDVWSRRVFTALLRRYDLKPYRYHGQRYTTVMVRVSKRFVDETLWPQFQEFSNTLRTHLAEITERVVSQVIHEDSSDAVVVAEPGQLEAPSGPPADSTAKEESATSESGGRPGDKERRKRRRQLKKKKRRRR